MEALVFMQLQLFDEFVPMKWPRNNFELTVLWFKTYPLDACVPTPSFLCSFCRKNQKGRTEHNA